MDRIRIVGGKPLNGTIPISGAKNATLPLMIASLLTDDTLVLENVPRLADVTLLQHILSNHGVDIMVKGKRPGDEDYRGQTLHISAARIVDTTAPYELVSKMRASFWVIGPLVARMGEARVSLPGGCAIGTRPVDLFIDEIGIVPFSGLPPTMRMRSMKAPAGRAGLGVSERDPEKPAPDLIRRG